MKKIGFVSLGCPKNLVDSEVMMGLVQRRGYQLTPRQEEAEIIVVNTCGFIDPAKQESIETILEMARWKVEGHCRKLVVTGCLVERYRNELIGEMPEIDAVLGTNEIEDILNVCDEDQSHSPPPGHATAYLYDHTTPRVISTPRYTAYIKISEGCDHTCNFCIIPRLRGKMRSRKPESVLEEARTLAENGVREVILVGQDTTHYGTDLGLHDGLAQLLGQVARVAGLHWVRFLYGYPHHVTDSLLDVIASEPTLCKYFDIPFQHVSHKILHCMGRGGSRSSIEGMIDRIRHRVPEAAIRTSFIVGYPGETGEDFQGLVDHVRLVEYDHLGVFAYSDEEATDAFDMKEKIPARTAQARRKRLMNEQARISRRINRRRLGQRVEVLLEGTSGESEFLLQGRMASQAPEIDGCVLINEVSGDRSVAPGDFVTVEITRAFDHDLLGRVM